MGTPDGCSRSTIAVERSGLTMWESSMESFTVKRRRLPASSVQPNETGQSSPSTVAMATIRKMARIRAATPGELGRGQRAVRDHDEWALGESVIQDRSADRVRTSFSAQAEQSEVRRFGTVDSDHCLAYFRPLRKLRGFV